jgi:hypothetical protein
MIPVAQAIAIAIRRAHATIVSSSAQGLTSPEQRGESNGVKFRARPDRAWRLPGVGAIRSSGCDKNWQTFEHLATGHLPRPA